MWEAMRDLVDANVLTPGELSDVVVPAATRRMEDITKTFEPDGRFEGLALDGVEVVEVPDPIWERYERTGDALELGEAHANSLRAWSGPSIAECLSYRPDCGVIVDRLFARVAERLSALPKPHRPYLAVVSLSKA